MLTTIAKNDFLFLDRITHYHEDMQTFLSENSPTKIDLPKTFYFIITCGATDAVYTETMLAALRGFTCCVPNAKEGGVVLGIGAMDAGRPAHRQQWRKPIGWDAVFHKITN